MDRPRYQLTGKGARVLRYNDRLGRPVALSVRDNPRELPENVVNSGRVRALLNSGELLEITNKPKGEEDAESSSRKGKKKRK